jgi:hypothetical protein
MRAMFFDEASHLPRPQNHLRIVRHALDVVTPFVVSRANILREKSSAIR